MRVDGHIHTPYCPHGTDDTFESYIETAISLGYEKITFTEHAPLPDGFIDTTPEKDSGMAPDQIDDYIEEVAKWKKKYKGIIDIRIGLEVDYIEGFEQKTKEFLNQYGPLLDDGILSVHFLKKGNEWYCLDYSPELFLEIVNAFGSVEKTYECYYKTILKSITADLGPYRPTRIGHITLVRKFQKKFPCRKSFDHMMESILSAVKQNGFSLDYNCAGVHKPDCLEPYPPNELALKAAKMGIALIYGSDAHQAKDLGQGRKNMIPSLLEDDSGKTVK
ncbi:MAG: histidinol-phosphatase HisJ [Bacillales bacterium]|nr:histidinol-phosphatase HisJ [Bacillales bacterium]